MWIRIALGGVVWCGIGDLLSQVGESMALKSPPIIMKACEKCWSCLNASVKNLISPELGAYTFIIVMG